MRVLIDTNVLLRFFDAASPQQESAKTATRLGVEHGWDLCVAPQTIYEFWVVAAQPFGPPQNGLGYSTEEAASFVDGLLETMRLLDDPPDLFDRWRTLVETHGVKGKPAHDARIVAAMQGHGVTHLLTFNVRDFTRYDQLTVLDPVVVIGDAAD